MAFVAGSLGLMRGSWGVRALCFTPGESPRVQEIAAIPTLDPQVAGFTLGLAVVTGTLRTGTRVSPLAHAADRSAQ